MRQHIVNFWISPSKVSRKCHKKSVSKISRHDYFLLFVKMSLCVRLVCFADFVVMTLHAVVFFLRLPNCFFKVCPPTFIAAVLKLFLPLPASAMSGTAISKKSAPTRFAAGTIYLRKNRNSVLPVTWAIAPNPLLYRRESLQVSKQPSRNMLFDRNDYWKLF